MATPFRLNFNLSTFSLEIAEAKAQEAGLDFDKYFNKVITNYMEKYGFQNCSKKSCRIMRYRYKKSVMKKKHEFVTCLSIEKNTTVSSLIEILLVLGLPKDKEAA